MKHAKYSWPQTAARKVKVYACSILAQSWYLFLKINVRVLNLIIINFLKFPHSGLSTSLTPAAIHSKLNVFIYSCQSATVEPIRGQISLGRVRVLCSTRISPSSEALLYLWKYLGILLSCCLPLLNHKIILHRLITKKDSRNECD